MTVQRIHENSEEWLVCFSGELRSENDLVLLVLWSRLTSQCCYDYGANASEAVQKIAIDQKDYRKCSLCVMVCCISKHIISNSKKSWLLRHLRRIRESCRRARKKEQYLPDGFYPQCKLDWIQLASFHFKTKSTKSKATFLRTSFLTLQIIYISTKTLELYANSLKQPFLQLLL